MKLFYIMLVLCLLLGCNSKKRLSVQTEQKLEQTEQKDIQTKETQRRDSSRQKISEVISNRESDFEMETITKTTEYDTSKPVNPITGKPPVFRETESTTKTITKDKENTSGKQSENNDISEQVSKEHTDKTEARHSTNNSEKLDQDKELDFFRVPWFWIVIGSIGVLAVGFCVKKKINPIKWFFPR